MNKTCGVYLIRCKTTDKVYIGESRYIERRWSVHKHHLNHNTHKRKTLQSDWNFFGKDDFEFIILEVVSEKLLMERSQWYMDHFECTNPLKGYNLEPNAISSIGSKRKSLTEEHKFKCGESIKRRWKEDRNCFLKNRKPTTEEVKVKISESKKNLWKDASFKAKMYKIKSDHARTELGRSNILKANAAAVTVRSLYYIVSSPSKQTWLVKNLAKFCRAFELKRTSLEDVVQGRTPSCYGWFVKKATQEDIQSWVGEKYE
jgi:group I intron endonuclease